MATRTGAVADIVAVDFVDDVAGTVRVLEARWVDGSAFIKGALAERAGEGDEWSAWSCAFGGANAVVGFIWLWWIHGVCGFSCEVENVVAVALLKLDV